MSGAPPARRPPPPGRWADPDLADGRAWSPTKPRSNYTIDLDSSRAIIPVIGNPRITYYVLLHPPILLTYPKSLSNPSTPESRHKGKQCKKSLHKQARKISSSGTILSPRSLGLARIRKTIQSPELPQEYSCTMYGGDAGVTLAANHPPGTRATRDRFMANAPLRSVPYD